MCSPVRAIARQLGRSPRRSPVSCAATPRRGRIAWSIERRRRSGTRSGGPVVRRSPSSPRRPAVRLCAGSTLDLTATFAGGATAPPGPPLGESWSPVCTITPMTVNEALPGAVTAARWPRRACLRTGRALRVPRARARGRGKTCDAAWRPAEADDRAVPGHWEGDLIIGLNRSAIGVERAPGSRCCCTCPPWPATAKHRESTPPLAEAVRVAIAASIATLPEQLRRSLTWDQGGPTRAAPHRHRRCRVLLDPHSPWRAAPTRTPTACCANLPQRHRPRPTAATTSTPSRSPSTPDPGKTPRPPPNKTCCDDRLNLAWLPASECATRPARRVARDARAISKASRTMLVRMCAATRQPRSCAVGVDDETRLT